MRSKFDQNNIQFCFQKILVTRLTPQKILMFYGEVLFPQY